MRETKLLCRIALTALVCILVVGVFAFGAQAKRSQYPGAHAGFTRHLSKEAKMSDDHTQKTVAVVPAVSVEVHPTAVPVAYLPLPEPPARPFPQAHLKAFRFRPPPAA